MNWQAERWARFTRVLRGETGSPMRLMVIAAHPDDETIGASLVLSRLPQIEVVYLTDGAPRDRNLWSPDAHGSREEYAVLRRHETENALACAGVGTQQITWLGGVDQETIFHSTELMTKLVAILQSRVPEIVITHPYEGGHPDHDTAALLARVAIVNAQTNSLLLEMTSYHADKSGCVTGEFLGADGDEIICELTSNDCARKRRMMDAHVSQRAVLAGFNINHERFRPAPAYDFTNAPHEGRLWYERMAWPMSGARWRSLAKDAIQEMEACDAAHSP
jgi:LmbE family N-acetylglucosaminyl deacetylase